MTAVSRTDKTRPWRVKVHEQPAVSSVEVHDHREGACTLPPADPGAEVQWTGCHWAPSTALTCSGEGRCGCELCQGSFGKRLDRRVERQAMRRRLRAGDPAELP